MRTTVVTPKEYEAALRKAVGRIKRQAEGAALDACGRAVSEAVTLTKDLGLVGLTGAYRRSWYHRRIENGAEFGNDSPYAGVIEHGRRPGATPPPFEPIREWVRRKLKVHEGDLDRVTQAIVWKIHVKGTRPYYIHHMTTLELPNWYRAKLREVLGEDP